MNEFKGNLREEIDTSQNPLIRHTRDTTDLIFMESSVAKATKDMKKYSQMMLIYLPMPMKHLKR